MKAVESEGASVQEAVDRALLLLGMTADETEVIVLREPGDEAAGPARVRVQVRNVGDGEFILDGKDAVPSNRTTPVEEPSPLGPDVSGELQVATAVVGDEGVSRETFAGLKEDSDDTEEPLSDEEGDRADRAGDFLEDLFELLDIDCYVEVAADRVDGKILIDIGGPDTGAIIGRKGAVLDAVEFVVNRAMDNSDGGGTRIALDAASYRARRTEKLRQVAADQAARVSRTKRPVSLEPMIPRERRIIHMALRSNSAVSTRSEGEGPDRHVIIEPARS